MHAPNPNATPAIPVLANPARDEMNQNETFWSANAQNALPIFTPPTAGTPRVPGPAPTLDLSPRQLSAISLLCARLNLETVAARLRLARATLYRWRTTHPAFRAELARRQQELRDTAARRLRLTLLRSLQVVTSEITKSYRWENRVKAALALLRHCDLDSLLAGPDDPLTSAACLDDQIRQDRASRNLDPMLAIDDADRDEFLALLQADGTFDDPPTPPAPTHRRLRGTPDAPPAPFPTPDTAPAPDPEFQI